MLKVGDKIKFKAVTRWGYKAAWRTINGFDGQRPTVRFSGWSNFIVNLGEIVDIETI